MGINIQQIYSGISAQIKNFLLKSLPGMNNRVVDLDLSTKWAQVAQNARFEATPGAVDKRAPVAYYNSSPITTAPVTGLCRYYTSGGADLWISTCGTGAYVGNDLTNSFTQIRSSLTTGKRYQFVVYQDLLIASNGYDPMWVYDADTVNNVTWQLGACKALVSTASGSMGVGNYYYAISTCASAGTSGVTTTDTWLSGAVSNTINMGASNGIDTFNKLMLHCDGVNGGTTFTDSETTPKTVTANGAANTSTAQFKFGTASGDFSGGGNDIYTTLLLHFENNLTDSSASSNSFTNTGVTFSNSTFQIGSYSSVYNGSSYITAPASSAFNMGSNNYTIDFWVNATSLSITADNIFCIQQDSVQGIYFQISSTQFNFVIYDSGLVQNTLINYSMTSGAWHHISLVRGWGGNNNIFAITVDGSVIGTDTAQNWPSWTSTKTLTIGADLNGGGYNAFLTGYLDEFRISQGVARWSSNFTPWTIPFVSGDYLTVPDSADFNMGTGDFTMDFWVYFVNLAGQQDFIDKSNASTYAMQFTKQTDNTLRMYFNNGSTVVGDFVTTTAPTFMQNTWYHLAFVRNGANAFIFVNGSSQVLTTNQAWATLVQGTSTLEIAGDSTNNKNYLYGFMDEVRVSKGIARWNTNFSPPTSAYSGSTYTSANLSHIPLGPPGTAARKIFRTKANGTTLFYVGILNDNTTTTFADTIIDSSLSTQMASVTDAMPLGAYLQLHRERLFVSGDPSNPNYIYYSGTYLPHYIQQTTQLTYMAIDNDDGDAITGIPIQLGLMVCIKRNTVRQLHITSPVSGADPTTWYADDPLAWIGSPAPYSVVQTPSGIVFLGYDHWYIFDGASVQPIIDEFDTDNILVSVFNDTIAYYNDGILLAAYTDISSAAQFHNRIMRWNFRRQALGIDTWTSSNLTGANCFAGRIGDSEAGDLFYGDSASGYVIKDQNSESVYSLITQTDALAGTWATSATTGIFIGGSLNAPTITVGASDSPTSIPQHICIFWDDPSSNPGAGWTEITGFNSNCIYITNTVNPLNTNPGVSHQHLLTGSIPVWTGNTVNAGDGNPGAVGAHTHLVSSNSDPSTPLPRCVFLRLFYKNTNTVEYQFPTGSIVMYDQADTPTGWMSLNTEGFNGYYVALNQAGIEYAFAVANITVWPTVGSIYSNNGANFTITFAPISGTFGIIYATSSSGAPQAAATLSKVSGTGDASVTYSAWTSSDITLNTINPSVHTHTFDIPTGTAAGQLANSDSGTNCPAFGHDHVVSGELATVSMDTFNGNPWEVPNVGFNFIKLVGQTSSWDGYNKNAYCLFAGSEAMSNGWTDATATYNNLFLKIVQATPTIGVQQNQTHTHTAGTFTTSFENAFWGNNGYRATNYAAPHNHQVTLTASSADAGNPPYVTFRVGYKILGQMAAFNDAISNKYTGGTYVSAPQQINAISLDKLYWNQNITGLSDTIQFFVRSGSTKAACVAASWVGPFTNPNGSSIATIINPTWVQYEIVFSCVNSTVNNPSVYFTDGFAVQYSYLQGATNAESSVNFIYRIGFRNLDAPTTDKIFKKVSTTHINTSGSGSFELNWTTENSTGSMLVSLSSNPTYWDSYFQSTALGKQIDIVVAQNDLNDLKLKQIELFYSNMQVVV